MVAHGSHGQPANSIQRRLHQYHAVAFAGFANLCSGVKDNSNRSGFTSRQPEAFMRPNGDGASSVQTKSEDHLETRGRGDEFNGKTSGCRCSRAGFGLVSPYPSSVAGGATLGQGQACLASIAARQLRAEAERERERRLTDRKKPS